MKKIPDLIQDYAKTYAELHRRSGWYPYSHRQRFDNMLLVDLETLFERQRQALFALYGQDFGEDEFHDSPETEWAKKDPIQPPSALLTDTLMDAINKLKCAKSPQISFIEMSNTTLWRLFEESSPLMSHKPSIRARFMDIPIIVVAPMTPEIITIRGEASLVLYTIDVSTVGPHKVRL